MNKIEGNLQEKRYKINNEAPVAVAVHCLDPRFRPAIENFLDDLFEGKKCAVISLAGGIHPVGTSKTSPSKLDFLNEQTDFVLTEMNLRQAVIINHDDCRWYHHHQGDCQVPEQLAKDLIEAKALIKRRHPLVEVIAYQAVLKDDEIAFKKM